MTDEEIKEYWRTAYCNEKHKKEELADKVNELQAQIGKMKSCRICVSYDDLAISDWSPCKTCKNKSNWELSD